MHGAPDHERAIWLAVADHGCTYAMVVQGDGSFAVPTGVPGTRWFVAVKQLQPRTFARAFVQVDPGAATDLGEADARRIYEHLTQNTEAAYRAGPTP